MKDIAIIGAGGFGREVQWLIERINADQINKGKEETWNIIGYIDDGVALGTNINGHKVLGGVDFLIERSEPLAVICAIGASKTRYKVVEKIRNNSYLTFPNIIDPSVYLSDLIQWGVGNIVCAGCILTVNISIGDFCIVNLDCTVGHDAELSSYVTAYPSVNISGSTCFGECVEIGTGVQILQGRSIGAGTIVGAGAVVVKDLPEECTAVGSPCKPIKFHDRSLVKMM